MNSKTSKWGWRTNSGMSYEIETQINNIQLQRAQREIFNEEMKLIRNDKGG